MRTATAAPDHSGSHAQPETVAADSEVLVPSIPVTAPPGPARNFGTTPVVSAGMSFGQTLPSGQRTPDVWQTAAACALHAGDHPGARPAPQHSGFVLQTAVVHGLQSQGSAAPSVSSSCRQYVGEK